MVLIYLFFYSVFCFDIEKKIKKIKRRHVTWENNFVSSELLNSGKIKGLWVLIILFGNRIKFRSPMNFYTNLILV
ncbi:hypothetical protein BV902_00935 [Sphingobacterium sp. B29]|nr:hypothetical protein BV902_00935 [Sphingobacterium sp. B29]